VKEVFYRVYYKPDKVNSGRYVID
jgi:hypothetical protein